MKCNCSRCRGRKPAFASVPKSGSGEFRECGDYDSNLWNILHETEGALACVTLNRPKVLIALNKSVITELKTAFESARDDSAVRGVILTGGDKAFAVGADISEMLHDTPLQAEEKTA